MRAFIAMPFPEQFNSHWQTIKKVCQQLQVKTYRVDKFLEEKGMLQEQNPRYQ